MGFKKTITTLLILAAAAAFVSLTYQSCGPAEPNMDQPTETTDSIGNPESISNKANLGATAVPGTAELLLERSWVQVTMASSEIVASAERPELLGQCLTGEALKVWQEEVLEQSVCEFKHKIPRDVVCTMIYFPPYLKLPVEGKSDLIALGEETSGCPPRTVGFCNNTQDLAQFFRDLKVTRDVGPCQ